MFSPDELWTFVELRHRSPHGVLGMHPLGAGPEVVVRAFQPGAAKVEIRALDEADGPNLELQRIHHAGVFEAVAGAARGVYAYELVVTDGQGKTQTARDPYSFLPTLSEEDLFLFGKGDERRVYEKLGAQLRTINGVAGTSFAVWAPNAQRVSVVGDFNGWDGQRQMMRALGASGVI